jgi:hypothetical protein
MQKITSKIKFIGGVLSLMLATIVGITVYINHASKQDSVVINISGKQRMLTQKITKETFWLQHQLEIEFTSLDAARNEFQSSLKDLQHGNKVRGIYAPPKQCIEERLTQVSQLWQKFDGYLSLFKVLLKETKELKEIMPKKNEDILNISDDVVKLMVKENLNGRLIDDAGRQRMLTQKIALYSSLYLISGDIDYINKFFQAYGLYASTLEIFLKDKTITQSLPLKTILEKNRQMWHQYAKYNMELMNKQKKLNQTLLQIKDINIVTLDVMDSAVDAYSRHSEEQRMMLQYFQYGAALIALLFMLYSARLTLSIEENFSDFLKHSEAFATSLENEEEAQAFKQECPSLQNDELTLASMHMSHFADKMNTVIEHAQQAINASEKAARELEAVSEQIDENLDDLELNEADKKDIDETIDTSEDIVIQTLEELSNTSKLLSQLQNNLNSVVQKTKPS